VISAQEEAWAKQNNFFVSFQRRSSMVVDTNEGRASCPNSKEAGLSQLQLRRAWENVKIPDDRIANRSERRLKTKKQQTCNEHNYTSAVWEDAQTAACGEHVQSDFQGFSF